MAKKKRKLSTYNLHMKAEMKRGKSFKAAVKSWRPRTKLGKALAVKQVGGKRAGRFYSVGGGLFSQSELTRARARVGAVRLGKRKVFKKRRVTLSMARRKRRTVKRRASGLRLGGLPNLLKNAGLAFAIGVGASTLIAQAGQQFNVPQLSKVAPLAGAFAAVTSTAGIGGIAAGASLLIGSGIIGGAAPSNGAGVGAFV